MTFKEDCIENFKSIFNSSKHLILAMEGCEHVELLQDVSNHKVFFTLSIWESSQHLDHYRHSELFEGVWSKTKVLFDDKPQAWSVTLIN